MMKSNFSQDKATRTIGILAAGQPGFSEFTEEFRAAVEDRSALPPELAAAALEALRGEPGLAPVIDDLMNSGGEEYPLCGLKRCGHNRRGRSLSYANPH